MDLPRKSWIFVGALVAGCSTASPAGSADASNGAPFDAPSDIVRDVIAGPWDGWDAGMNILQTDMLPSYEDVPHNYPHCEPGSVEDCVCTDGEAGVQACQAVQGSFQRCRCDLRVPPTPPLPARLIGPLSGQRTTSQRPTLRWVLPDGVTVARVELCDDRACTRLLAQALVTGTSWRSPTALRPGVVFWRVRGLGADGSVVWTSATWEFGVRHRDTPVDSAWGTLKDFNGDGFDDMVGIVGNARPENRLYIYLGQRDGVAATPSQTLLPDPSVDSTEFNGGVAAGDVNGDGLADVTATTLRVRPDVFGVLFVGARSGPPLVETRRYRTASREVNVRGYACTIEDFNGDGYGDVIVVKDRGGNASVFLGGPAGISETPTSENYAIPRLDDRDPDSVQNSVRIVGAGDVDGDGYGDVAIKLGSELFAIYGNPRGDLTSRSIDVIFNDRYNKGDIRAADFNGDRLGDLIIATPRATFRSFGGRPVLLDQDPIGSYYYQDWQKPQITTWPVASRPGDLDGDGYPEVAWINPCTTTMDRVCTENTLWLFYGSPQGVPLVPTWTLRGTMTGVGSPGDVDGDGYDDLVVLYPTRFEILASGGSRTPTSTTVRPMPDPGFANYNMSPAL